MPRRPTRKYRARRKGLKKASKPLYKAVKAIAKNEAMKAQETKFLSANTGNAQQVTNTLISKVGGGLQYLNIAIPPLYQGATSSDVIGQKCTLVGGRTQFHFNFIRGASENTDLVVKLFCLYSKAIKCGNQATSLPTGDLLRIGQNAQSDWDPNGVLSTTPIYLDARKINQWILNDLAWTGKVHTFRFTKNRGSMNYDSQITPEVVGDVPNISPGLNTHEFIWNWGADHKGKVLKYDQTPNTFNFPSNFCPMWGVVAYFPDGTPNYTNPTQPEPPLPPLGVTTVPVEVTVTNQLFYKDA